MEGFKVGKSNIKMDLEQRIEALAALGNYIGERSNQLDEAILKSNHYNKWFTEDNVNQSLKAIATHYLDPVRMEKWLSGYSINGSSDKTVGLVMAGNIPLVGFHDFLTVLATGNKVQLKLSSKDQYLLPHLIENLIALEPGFNERIQVVERLNGFDAVIATGGNNSARYFEYYFGKYPHVIRKNRNSIAILTGNETEEELIALGKDIFQYFGLGCRNVSKLFVPKEYNFEHLLKTLEPFNTVMDHEGYKHNYDYQRTLLLMNQVPHFASDFLMLSENKSIHSPISTLYYEYYDSINDLKSLIVNHQSDIQCVISKEDLPNALPFGKAQEPELWDYADDVDTVEFLQSLHTKLV